jgi:DegV family protein with EDD domain
MSERVAVVTDSAASIPGALREQWGIDVVPLDIVIDGQPAPEGSSTGVTDVLHALESDRSVTTSQPSVGTFIEVYRRVEARGAREIVSVHLSGQVSGTVSTAQVAAKEVAIPVTVVDSRTLAMATGFAALAAASLARSGATAADVASEATRVSQSSSLLFTVDTLEYLRRGGRVPRAVAAIGDALSIRPILGVVDGEVDVLERVRTTAKARSRILDMLSERMSELSHPGFAVMALGSDAVADDALAEFATIHPHLSMAVSTRISAVLAVHGGPGAFACVVADLPEGLH